MEIHAQLDELGLQVGVGDVQAHCGLRLILPKAPRCAHIVFQGLDVLPGEHSSCHGARRPKLLYARGQDGVGLSGCADLNERSISTAFTKHSTPLELRSIHRIAQPHPS